MKTLLLRLGSMITGPGFFFPTLSRINRLYKLQEHKSRQGIVCSEINQMLGLLQIWCVNTSEWGHVVRRKHVFYLQTPLHSHWNMFEKWWRGWERVQAACNAVNTKADPAIVSSNVFQFIYKFNFLFSKRLAALSSNNGLIFLSHTSLPPPSSFSNSEPFFFKIHCNSAQNIPLSKFF